MEQRPTSRCFARPGLQMLIESKAFYKPTPNSSFLLIFIENTRVNDYTGGGSSGPCAWKARPNYYTLIDNVYSKPSEQEDIAVGTPGH